LSKWVIRWFGEDDMSGERLRNPHQRAERATRILDSAAELLLRHGYRRVTIDDVAAGAGIGKGTVYLHWKTREQLFGAVFEREVEFALEELRQQLMADPAVCLLHRFAGAYFLSILRRPLLRGFLLADPDLLGRLTDTRDPARDALHEQLSDRYFELLAGHHLLRADLEVHDVGYAYQAVFEGFLRAEAGANQDHRADLLARTVQRAFENETTIDDVTLRGLASALADLLEDIVG
jgi:AcrR family transcriptional regulator